jgi:hypothetical protein
MSYLYIELLTQLSYLTYVEFLNIKDAQFIYLIINPNHPLYKHFPPTPTQKQKQTK